MKIGMICLLGLLALLSGCGSLVYVHTLDLGVDLSAAPTQGDVKLVVGFEQNTVASVPKKGSNDAQAVTSASYLYVDGLDTLHIAHAVATGKPAVLIAASPADLETVVDKLFGTTGTTPSPDQTSGNPPATTAAPATQPAATPQH